MAKTLDIPAANGGFSVREVVRLAFFVRRPHRAMAQDAVHSIGLVVDALPPPLLSMFAIESGDWLDFDAEGLKAQTMQRLVGADCPINGSASLSGDQANLPDAALEYAGLAIDRPTFNAAACMLTFHVGASVVQSHWPQLHRLFEQIVTTLAADAAYMDIALIGDQTRCQSMSRRFLCVDISQPRAVARDIGDRLPGVFWCNYIGPAILATLGGEEKVSRALSPTSSFQMTSNGGAYVVLGAAPSRGDTNLAEGVGDRATIARLAHSADALHVPKRIIYFEAEDSLDDAEAQENWHLRYTKQ